jgi:hypothetical protein
LVRRGQDAARRLAVLAKVKNYFQTVHPIFAPHFSDRNYPSSFDHFVPPSLFCAIQSICRKFEAVLQFNLKIGSFALRPDRPPCCAKIKSK